MKSPLAPSGTARLLETLSPFIPDEFINELLAPRKHPGKRNHLSAAQLWRTHLLALLTPVHSFNGLIRLLPEQRSWRAFAQIHHRHRTPDVRMLNEFRTRAGVAGLRRINERLLQPLLKLVSDHQYAVAIIDATDLPASTADKKKMGVAGRRAAPAWARVHSGPDIRGSLSATRNTPCGCGCARMNRRCC
jgi:hypothetical protein